ncbi:MAG: DNA-protecting protein DprA [Chloroflexi bacterium]|nr:DNA-processing protein DprA [Anaerolineaceae bacterium]NLI44117.1 DNA-protecting protein DprA [Chloroflexota bacterium]HOE34642.1 DNA-processing protein DprA [Anaerolineaceae bacterium]HOT24834.1 DNA-processing protein DprA [Anaerolineaceae bacterium]HQH57603.1 DNA-processing protein DprA [Anaerolineaceae bacterium]
MGERDYWLAFSTVRGIGAVRFRRLLNHFGSLSRAWHASRAELLAAGLTEKLSDAIILKRSALDPEGILPAITKKSIQVLTWEDESYPRYLKEIEQPPPVLYYRGSILPQDDLAIAIVGTRNVTAYGRQLTKDTATYLAANGVTIVSGLARGVDAIAHQTAVEQGGRTLAVLGSGVDVIYPPEHRALAESIAAHGALISDYPPGTQPDGVNFPPRNRIISGLSRGTVVIEAGEKSGALITAKFSIDQGRDVFAAPGSVLSPMSRGTNNLLAAGAVPLTSPTVILKHLNISQTRPIPDGEKPSLDVEEARILRALGHDTLHIDDLCGKLGTSVEKLTAQLTMMELKGLVLRARGMEYSANQSWTLD